MRLETLVMASLILVLALSMASAVNPSLVSHLEGKVIVSGHLDVMGDIRTITLNLTIPQNTSNQLVYCNASTIDIDGIKMAQVQIENPPKSLNYSVICQVKTDSSVIRSLPASYDVTPYLEYTKPTVGVPSDDLKIKNLAENITGGITDDFQKLAQINHWVHDYIQYDESLTGKYMPVDWILQNRRGVCVEYSALFAALARSLGYPTRFVGGLAYGDSGPTGHMWVEVYLGKWVPFDPTWDLGGSLDATHIVFFKSASRKVMSSMTYKGTGGKVEWETESGVDLGKIEITRMDEEDYPVTYSFILPASVLPMGSSTFLALNLSTDRYLVTTITLANCKSSRSILTINPESQVVALEPGKASLAVWEIHSGSLDPGYIYTCPVTVNSKFTDVRSKEITVKEREKIPYSVSLSTNSPGIGEEFYIYISSEKSQAFYGIYDNQLDSSTGSETTLKFRAESPGKRRVLVSSSAGGLKELWVNVVPSSVAISRAIVPSKVLVGDEVRISLILKGASDKPTNIALTVSYPGGTIKKVITVSGEEAVSFNLKFDNPGKKEIRVHLEGEGTDMKRTYPLEVIPRPSVTLSTYEKVGGKTLVEFKVNGEPKDVVLLVDGKQFNFSENVTLKLDPGEHNLLVKWSDGLGNNYSKMFAVDIEENKAEGVVATFSWIMIAFLVLTAVVFLVAAVDIMLGIGPRKKKEAQ